MSDSKSSGLYKFGYNIARKKRLTPFERQMAYLLLLDADVFQLGVWKLPAAWFGNWMSSTFGSILKLKQSQPMKITRKQLIRYLKFHFDWTTGDLAAKFIELKTKIVAALSLTCDSQTLRRYKQTSQDLNLQKLGSYVHDAVENFDALPLTLWAPLVVSVDNRIIAKQLDKQELENRFNNWLCRILEKDNTVKLGIQNQITEYMKDDIVLTPVLVLDIVIRTGLFGGVSDPLITRMNDGRGLTPALYPLGMEIGEKASIERNLYWNFVRRMGYQIIGKDGVPIDEIFMNYIRHYFKDDAIQIMEKCSDQRFHPNMVITTPFPFSMISDMVGRYPTVSSYDTENSPLSICTSAGKVDREKGDVEVATRHVSCEPFALTIDIVSLCRDVCKLVKFAKLVNIGDNDSECYVDYVKTHRSLMTTFEIIINSNAKYDHSLCSLYQMVRNMNELFNHISVDSYTKHDEPVVCAATRARMKKYYDGLRVWLRQAEARHGFDLEVLFDVDSDEI